VNHLPIGQMEILGLCVPKKDAAKLNPHGKLLPCEVIRGEKSVFI
jgi:hypothetical protein